MFNNDSKSKNIKLYVRRVFITEDCEELIPEYLNFIKGIVDSEDLPLNISREILQQSRIMRVMKKNITKRCIELINEISCDRDRYNIFYNNYSRNIKLGVYEDSNNRDKLMELLRYYSSESGVDLTNLCGYVERMKEGQNDIYYITGENKEKVSNSVFVEGIKSRGYEVLYMIEPIDEYCLQQMTEYKGKRFVSITKEGLELPEDEGNKDKMKLLKEENNVFCEGIKELLGDKIEKVYISDRLKGEPCCIVTGQFGWSANMERIMKAQTLNNESMNYMVSKKSLEINPGHKIIKSLKERIHNGGDKVIILDLVELLYNSALLSSGFTLEDPSLFTKKLNNIIMLGLGIESEETEIGVDKEIEEETEIGVDKEIEEETEIGVEKEIEEETEIGVEEEMERVD